MQLDAQPWLTHPNTQTLLAAFTGAGVELRFVGGCVRDALMGRPVKDVDAATPAPPEAVMALLGQAGIKTVPTGLRHGTVTAVIDHTPFEVTTLRTDVACDGRHADVAFTDDWRADAARRDFTMNALYCDAQGVITDFFGGVADALAGRVTFIGDASARITEDALRMLRFFRFFATHGRPPADEAALAACRYHAGMIGGLSGERIQHEMFKLLAAPDAADALTLMEQTGVLPYVITHHSHPAPFIYHSLTEAADRMPHRMQALIRLGLLLRQCPQPEAAASTIGQRWKLSNRDKHDLKRLTNTSPLALPADDVTVMGWLRAHGREMTDALIVRDHAEAAHDAGATAALLERAGRLPIPEFPVTGADLLKAGVAQGPQLGEALKQLEAAWVDSGYALGKDALLAQLSLLPLAGER